MTGADMYPAGSLQLLRTSVRARLTTMDDVALEIVRGDADIVAGDRWFLIYDGAPVPCRLRWTTERIGESELLGTVLALRVGAIAGDVRLGATFRAPMLGRPFPAVWSTRALVRPVTCDSCKAAIT